MAVNLGGVPFGRGSEWGINRQNSRGPADRADFDADEIRIQPETPSDPDLICGGIHVICGPLLRSDTLTLQPRHLNLAKIPRIFGPSRRPRGITLEMSRKTRSTQTQEMRSSHACRGV